MEDIRDVLARRLRELRTAAGLSQDELARRAGDMTRAYVSEIESAKRIPSVVTVARLAQGLAIDASVLLQGGRVRNPKPKKPPETAADRLGRKIAKIASGASERQLRAFEIVAKAFFRRGA